MLNIKYPADLQRSIQKYSVKPISTGNRDQMAVGINEQQWYDIVHRCALVEKKDNVEHKYIQEKQNKSSILHSSIDLDHRDYYEPPPPASIVNNNTTRQRQRQYNESPQTMSSSESLTTFNPSSYKHPTFNEDLIKKHSKILRDYDKHKSTRFHTTSSSSYNDFHKHSNINSHPAGIHTSTADKFSNTYNTHTHNTYNNTYNKKFIVPTTIKGNESHDKEYKEKLEKKVLYARNLHTSSSTYETQSVSRKQHTAEKDQITSSLIWISPPRRQKPVKSTSTSSFTNTYNTTTNTTTTYNTTTTINNTNENMMTKSMDTTINLQRYDYQKPSHTTNNASNTNTNQQYKIVASKSLPSEYIKSEYPQHTASNNNNNNNNNIPTTNRSYRYVKSKIASDVRKDKNKYFNTYHYIYPPNTNTATTTNTNTENQNLSSNSQTNVINTEKLKYSNTNIVNENNYNNNENENIYTNTNTNNDKEYQFKNNNINKSHRIKNVNFFEKGIVNNSQNILIIHKPKNIKETMILPTTTTTTTTTHHHNQQSLYEKPKLAHSPQWKMCNKGLVAEFKGTEVVIPISQPIIPREYEDYDYEEDNNDNNNEEGNNEEYPAVLIDLIPSHDHFHQSSNNNNNNNNNNSIYNDEASIKGEVNESPISTYSFKTTDVNIAEDEVPYYEDEDNDDDEVDAVAGETSVYTMTDKFNDNVDTAAIVSTAYETLPSQPKDFHTDFSTLHDSEMSNNSLTKDLDSSNFRNENDEIQIHDVNTMTQTASSTTPINIQLVNSTIVENIESPQSVPSDPEYNNYDTEDEDEEVIHDDQLKMIDDLLKSKNFKRSNNNTSEGEGNLNNTDEFEFDQSTSSNNDYSYET